METDIPKCLIACAKFLIIVSWVYTDACISVFHKTNYFYFCGTNILGSEYDSR